MTYEFNDIKDSVQSLHPAQAVEILRVMADVLSSSKFAADATAGVGSCTAGGATQTLLPYLQKANWCLVDTNNPAFGSNYTQHVQMTLEAPFVAVQIGVVNGYTTGGPQTVKVAVSTMAAAGDPATTAPLNNGGTWVNAGVGGANLTVPAATVANAGLGIAWGDIVPLASLARSDGGKFPLLCVRVENPTGNNLTGIVGAANASNPFEVENYAAAPYGRLYRARSQGGVLGVTTPGSMNTTVSDQSYGAPIIIRYWLRNGVGRTITVFGDSIWCGYGQSTKNSWTWIREGAHQLSTPSHPVEICSLANSGYTMQSVLQRVQALAAHCKGTIALIPSNSPNSIPNGAIAQATLDASAAYYSQIYSTLTAQQIPVITGTVLPTSTAAKGWGTSDALRVADNAAKAAASRAGAVTIDIASVATSGVDGTGQQQLYPAEADGLHPAYGLAAIGAPLLVAAISW